MEDLKPLEGLRVKSLKELKKWIENLTNKKVVSIFESESEPIDGSDNMIDYEFKNNDEVYTIFYLKDNANNYYITEV
jgi:hypothetical protein